MKFIVGFTEVRDAMSVNVFVTFIGAFGVMLYFYICM